MPQSFSLTVVRPEDLVVLVLDFRDVDLTPPAGAGPGSVTGTAGSRLIVGLQPQHVAEQAFFESADPIQADPPEPGGPQEPPAPGSVQSRVAAPSRLAFSIPAGRVIPLTLAELLAALRTLPLSLTPVSAYDPEKTGCGPFGKVLGKLGLAPRPDIAVPRDDQTAIEAPWRLVLSPGPFGRWAHEAAPVEHGGVTELWHTRLGREPAGDPEVRAVWSPDFRLTGLPAPLDLPFRSSLNPRDRSEIVHLTSNWRLGVDPKAVATERLMLSTLGTWLRVQGDWEPLPDAAIGGQKLSVEQWRHDAAMGRDQFVRVVRAGYLLPFGHRASLVKVTERKFVPRKQGFVAVLRQRMYIIVRQPVLEFTHRSLPFQSVTIRTRMTPDLADPAGSALPGQGQLAFWPRVAGKDGAPVLFRFHLDAMDRAGRACELSMPLVYVDRGIAEDVATMQTVCADYAEEKGAEEKGAREPELHGRAIAYAPERKPGDTSLDTASIRFRAAAVEWKPAFVPEMDQAQVSIPAVQEIVGVPVSSTIEWEPTYTDPGLGEFQKLGEVFAQVVGEPPAVDFGSADRAGGLAKPEMKVTGVSRALGPTMAPLAEMVEGAFSPAAAFPSVKLLGAIELKSIIAPVTSFDPEAGAGRVPGITPYTDPATGDTGTAWVWEVRQEPGKKHIVDASLVAGGPTLFAPGPDAAFTLRSAVLHGKDGTVRRSANGLLSDFSVFLLPAPEALQLVKIQFQSLEFTAREGKKPDVTVRLDSVTFLGPLEFVNELQKYIPSGGFEDPPHLELVSAPDPGLNVGYTLGLPDIPMGMVSIQNVSLSAGFFIPFTEGKMNFRFAFCERHQPFTVTVSGLGGGGFFGIDLGLQGVVRVEAAIEFGASVALNLGVASGAATVMGGFYFQGPAVPATDSSPGGGIGLTAYVRAAGALSVLGIVTVSVEFYLGLTYQTKPKPSGQGLLWGEASMTVKVKICFFSKSVSVSFRREFAGSDPTFRTMMPLEAWNSYCDAFAALPGAP